ncbi:cupin domain-containing protein [Clostridium sp. AM58-1XD]|uniref:helix-turn-helix domain-containing protein n=1 Tax=Clostridium sp. AM58-1XD TaxID=2292307 RepID=UPI000E4860FC|nr:cupin domain-containing protein [Clostridium sp. AM58-1XD]RGZ00150.1 cupin domain-containing protein [Clostridium sp. AM58-1XD]
MSDLNIGQKTQQYRKQKNMSLKALAELTQLSPSMLSQLERGLASPSINTLRVIADALEVPLFRFFSEDEDTTEFIVHPDSRKTLALPSSPDVAYEFLTPDLSGTIEYCIMTLEPGGFSSSCPKSHNGEEVGYILEGPLTIHFDNAVHELHTGDSLRLPPHTNHRWENSGTSVAKLLFAVTPPSF